MKNRANQILLALTIVTAILYAYVMMVWIGVVPSPGDSARFFAAWVYLGVGFHAVPCFCLQLLVCRAAKRTAVRLIPVYLLAAVAVLFSVGFSTATGWDTLGWGLLLLLCVAPAAAYGLAWGVYGICRARQHTNK